MDIKLNFKNVPAPNDLKDTSVIVIGKINHLKSVKFDVLSKAFASKIGEDVWKSGMETLKPLSVDKVSLYLNKITAAALPEKCSRHNAPSRAGAITGILKGQGSFPLNKNIVIVCEKENAYASGCAVAKAYPLYSRKTKSSSSPDAGCERTINVSFVLVDKEGGGGSSLTDSEIGALENAAYGVRLAAKIVDTPCNDMHVDAFLEEIRKIGKILKIEPTIIQGEALLNKQMGGIYGVGKAAEHAPALAVLSHTPKEASKTVAWVGKGIVYDTGGLSIKDKNNMPGMKRDCGGAAGILGAFYSAVKNGFSENLHAVFCLAENAVGPLATRPDDIHLLYSGKTVEINNTDAEGRLVVSDGVVYADRDLNADFIVDMCTLTGAQGVATGRHHAAILTNGEKAESCCLAAGRKSGEVTFPLVYCPELHFPEFTSAVADMKNSVADRSNAQASCAGLFINAHLGFDFKGTWLHLDIAAPAYEGERATGFGVALLNVLFGSYSKSAMLQDISPLPKDYFEKGAAA